LIFICFWVQNPRNSDRSRSFFIKKYFICFVFIVNWILNKIVFLCFLKKRKKIKDIFWVAYVDKAKVCINH
jgi:hypothetical protein